MHLWPSKHLRNSFKLPYLKNLEWNHRRMAKDPQSPSEEKLLENENKVDDGDMVKCEDGVTAPFWQELLLVLSCCYCCFCCGGNETPNGDRRFRSG